MHHRSRIIFSIELDEEREEQEGRESEAVASIKEEWKELELTEKMSEEHDSLLSKYLTLNERLLPNEYVFIAVILFFCLD